MPCRGTPSTESPALPGGGRLARPPFSAVPARPRPAAAPGLRPRPGSAARARRRNRIAEVGGELVDVEADVRVGDRRVHLLGVRQHVVARGLRVVPRLRTEVARGVGDRAQPLLAQRPACAMIAPSGIGRPVVDSQCSPMSASLRRPYSGR